nr:wall-associated receptor kinase 5-like [Ipomoea batatas]
MAAISVLLLVFMLQAIAKGDGLAMPGCKDKCGNLTIAYPFGIGKPGCYLDEPFRVYCDNSTQAATLPHLSPDLTIYSISSDSFTIQAYGSSMDYNRSSGKNLERGDVGTFGFNLLQPHFTISNTRNKFVAVGCDVYSYLKDFRSQSIIAGCASFCVNKERLESQPNFSSCSGYGCCQTPIQTRLDHYFVSGGHTMNTDDTIWSAKECNYNMVVEESFDKFDDINCSDITPVPMVMDWSIGNLSCAKVKKSICGHNAYCANSTRGEGYLCRCSQGYQGNPYLPRGCQDIDECEIQKENTCPKNADCVNIPGSYYCRCRQGYRSDLSKSSPYGYACIPDHKRHMLVMLICAGVGVGISILLLVVTGFWLNRKFKKRKLEKNKERFFKRNGGILLQKQMSICNRGSVLEIKIFKTEELEKATDNFNQSRILGKGGLGTVYKGMLSDGCIVAVKKSNKVNEGQKVISSNKSDEGLVIRFKTSLKQKDGLFEILDHAVANEGGEEEIFAVAKLAKRCIKLNSRKRPGMMEVATELQRLARTNGECLQRRPNDCEDSCFSSGVMSFDHNFDIITDETTVLIDE